MANDLRDNGFLPPDVTTYNTGDIPWVYPPLGIYLVALLGGGLDLFRILPAAWAIATLPAVWLLARALIGDRGALVALVAYGLAAPAYAGVIAGGGVTRGPGLLLAVLTMWAVVRGNVAGAGVLGGLTILLPPDRCLLRGARVGDPVGDPRAATRGCSWRSDRARHRRRLVRADDRSATGSTRVRTWFVPMTLRHGSTPARRPRLPRARPRRQRRHAAGRGAQPAEPGVHDRRGRLVIAAAPTLGPPRLARRDRLRGRGRGPMDGHPPRRPRRPRRRCGARAAAAAGLGGAHRRRRDDRGHRRRAGSAASRSQPTSAR